MAWGDVPSNTPDGWEHFEHGADIGVRGIASSKTGAFEQAALVLMASITEPGKVVANSRKIFIQGHRQDPCG